MIDHIKVERLGKIFTGFFVDLNFNEKLKDITFLEILLGFILGFKKVLKSIELVGVLTHEQIVKINEVLDKAVEENIELDTKSELYKLLKQFSKEEGNVESKDE